MGARTDPWGTPQDKCDLEDKHPSTVYRQNKFYCSNKI